MKKWISMLALMLALATPVLAEDAHSGAQCPMHGEKNAILTEAATALEGTNADLAAKLKDLAATCCGKH